HQRAGRAPPGRDHGADRLGRCADLRGLWVRVLFARWAAPDARLPGASVRRAVAVSLRPTPGASLGIRGTLPPFVGLLVVGRGAALPAHGHVDTHRVGVVALAARAQEALAEPQARPTLLALDP